MIGRSRYGDIGLKVERSSWLPITSLGRSRLWLIHIWAGYVIHCTNVFFLRTIFPKMLSLDICEKKKSEERLSLLRRTAEPEIGGRIKNNTAQKS